MVFLICNIATSNFNLVVILFYMFEIFFKKIKIIITLNLGEVNGVHETSQFLLLRALGSGLEPLGVDLCQSPVREHPQHLHRKVPSQWVVFGKGESVSCARFGTAGTEDEFQVAWGKCDIILEVRRFPNECVVIAVTHSLNSLHTLRKSVTFLLK